MSTKKMIQRYETWRTDLPLFCPFCGEKAYDPNQEAEPILEGCKHVLFIAVDDGFEHRSDKFDALMGIVGKEDADIELGEKGYDGFTDQVELADSVKFAAYTPAPSFYGLYIGFAPTDDE